ncbi:hypothetical protein Tco_0280872 [Tanacetum coccineum]
MPLSLRSSANELLVTRVAEVERPSRLQKLLDEENKLKRSLSSMNKKINTSKANNGNINEQMEASKDEIRLKKHAEEIRVAKEDAKRKLTKEHNRVYRLQEALDSLRATISIEFDTEKSRGVDQDLKDLGIRMNNWKESVTSLSLIFRDIKGKFPKLDHDPNKAEAAQIAV